MKKITNQMGIWHGKFGREYTERNPQTVKELESLYRKCYGITRTEMNSEFLCKIDSSAKILEVGSNIGIQLLCLQKMGFKNLYGIELQWYAVEQSKRKTKKINIIQGSAFDIPFKDNFFDLVFTSGLLIHISPRDINDVLDEIYRCSRKYIWGFEYYSNYCTEVVYRGKSNLLWKNDFAKLYIQRFPDLRLIKERKFKYLDSENVDSMFLLEKKGIK